MIHRQKGCVIFECDECGDTRDGAAGESFGEVWKAAKDGGWRTRPIGEDWLHSCPACEEKRK
jgi:hypothetical protein